jgi:hypothetical protein
MGATKACVYFLPAVTVQKTISTWLDEGKRDQVNGSPVHPDESFVHLDGSPVHLKLKEIAKSISDTMAAPKKEVDIIILKLCENRFLTVSDIAQLLNRCLKRQPQQEKGRRTPAVLC